MNSCDSCNWFEVAKLYRDKDGEIRASQDGYCKRYAPKPVMSLVGENYLVAWPVVLWTDGCGEWEWNPSKPVYVRTKKASK